MNKSLATVLVLVALVATIAVVWGPAMAQEKDGPKPAPAQKFEYKVIVAEQQDLFKMEVSLNKAGEDRWELVSTVSEVIGGSAQQPNRTRAHLLLKRSK